MSRAGGFGRGFAFTGGFFVSPIVVVLITRVVRVDVHVAIRGVAIILIVGAVVAERCAPHHQRLGNHQGRASLAYSGGIALQFAS